MTYFIDSLETSFKYLAGFQQKTLGKLYPRTWLYMPKVLKKQARKTLENSCQQALSLKTLEQPKWAIFYWVVYYYSHYLYFWRGLASGLKLYYWSLLILELL